MFHYRQVLARLRAGDSERDIARSGLMGRKKAAAFRQLAHTQGWLHAPQMPEEADIATAVGRARRAGNTVSSVEPWRDLLRIARNNNVPRETRKAAVFWVGQEVQEEATRGLSDIIREPGDLEVRKSAIFALSQQRSGDAVGALISIAKTNPDKELRKSAIFWLGQSDDPRVLAMFEEILLKN